MEKSHLAQAKLWLDAAKYVLNSDSKSKEIYVVSIALAIRAIIKANDSLTFRFLNTTARRHDDARRLFEELVKRNFIKSELSRYKQTIQDAINNKARAEYRIAYFSKSEADTMIRKAERFIQMVEKALS